MNLLENALNFIFPPSCGFCDKVGEGYLCQKCKQNIIYSNLYFNQLDLYLYNGDHQHFDFSYQSEFVYEIEHIHNCLKNNLIESPVMNKEKTFETIKLVNQLYQKWQ